MLFKETLKLFTDPITRQEIAPPGEKLVFFVGKMLAGFPCHRHRDPWLVMLQGDLIRSPPLPEECNSGSFLAVTNVI